MRPSNRFVACLAAFAGLLAACGGGEPRSASTPRPSGPSLIIEGDRLCAELIRREAEYLKGSEIDVAGYVAIGDNTLAFFRRLMPPAGDARWTEGLQVRWEAIDDARRRDGDVVGALWQFIGAARVAGLWLCGPDQAAVLDAAVADAAFSSTIPPEEYATRLDGVIAKYAPEHEEYHHDPDPEELKKRLEPGDEHSHGPGYLTIQSAMIDAMAALPGPAGQERQAAIFLYFMRQSLAAETAGIRTGGVRGQALFEPSYAYTHQAIGVACLVWKLNLCG
ncbi:MAG TPA: hypothetical protein VM841_12100 [Actinomycetota bacterium]|nr:hypothetical protein [Actinomycetota bacterium]